jgi:hypothetical protein
MQKVVFFCINNSGWLLIITLAVSLGFATAATFGGGFCPVSFTAGFEAMLKLLMQIESPHSAMPSPSPAMIPFGWIVCILGWLIIPLLIAAVIDVGLQRSETDRILSFKFYQIGVAEGLSGSELTKFIETMIRKTNEAVQSGGQ